MIFIPMKKAELTQMKEGKSSKIILVCKTLYGFQKLDVHNKFVGVHLYVVNAICRTLVLRISSQIINFFHCWK